MNWPAARTDPDAEYAASTRSLAARRHEDCPRRMSTARKLTAEALQLDEAERATMALELMDSISRPDPHDEAAWITEIEGRARRALSGESEGVDVDTAIDGISRDLGL